MTKVQIRAIELALEVLRWDGAKDDSATDSWPTADLELLLKASPWTPEQVAFFSQPIDIEAVVKEVLGDSDADPVYSERRTAVRAIEDAVWRRGFFRQGLVSRIQGLFSN